MCAARAKSNRPSPLDRQITKSRTENQVSAEVDLTSLLKRRPNDRFLLLGGVKRAQQESRSGTSVPVAL
jgi:RNase P/RNase MRP subunit p30